MKIINKKDKLYYARIIPQSGLYEVCDLIVRTVADDWFVAYDKKDRHAYLFGYNSLDDIVFDNRETALRKVKKAEANREDINEEIYYEEY